MQNVHEDGKKVQPSATFFFHNSVGFSTPLSKVKGQKATKIKILRKRDDIRSLSLKVLDSDDEVVAPSTPPRGVALNKNDMMFSNNRCIFKRGTR